MSDIVLQANRICKSFKDGKREIEVLKDFEFEVKAGEMIAVVGASGSGKSTLLHILGGLDRPSSGAITICGQTLGKLSQVQLGQLRNHYLGFVYQFHHLLPEFDALENIAMPLLIRGLQPHVAKAKAKELLEQVGLSERATHRLGELSGGERQRVAIARALVTEPACVLADEPTGNLDHNTAAKIFELMQQLNQQLHTAFLIVTHDQSIAAKLDRIVQL